MRAIYSRAPVRVANFGALVVLNPIHFVAPLEGVTTVYIAGDEPRIKAEYEAMGVSVRPLPDLDAAPSASASDEATTEQTRPRRSKRSN